MVTSLEERESCGLQDQGIGADAEIEMIRVSTIRCPAVEVSFVCFFMGYRDNLLDRRKDKEE